MQYLHTAAAGIRYLTADYLGRAAVNTYVMHAPVRGSAQYFKTLTRNERVRVIPRKTV